LTARVRRLLPLRVPRPNTEIRKEVIAKPLPT
jgi:hypothetical protein